MIQVAILGYACIDHLFVVRRFPNRGQKVRIGNSMMICGGQAATAASALQRWGIPVRCIARVGDDHEGELIREELTLDGVATDSILGTVRTKTQHASICIDALSGERTIFWERNPRLDLHPLDLNHEWFRSIDWLLIDGHEVDADIQAAQWVKASGGRVVLDAEEIGPQRDRLLPLVDVCIASSDFGSREFGISDPIKTLDCLSGFGIGVVGVTLGAEGVVARAGAETFTIPGRSVTAIDTTGAGDIFHAGYLYGMIQNWIPIECLQFANCAAGLSCRVLGGRPGIPPIDEVLAATGPR